MTAPRYLEGANPYPPEVIEEYVARGWWPALTYGDLLDRNTARHPDKVAIIDDRTELAYTGLRERVDRLAIALLQLGLKKYDRLILQLPNRHEFIIAYFALHRIGAVPVLAIPRHEYREVSHFFKLTEPVGWIVPLRDGNRDFRPLIDQIRNEAASLQHLIVLDDGEALPPGARSLARLIEDVRPGDYPDDYLRQFRPDANDVAFIMPTGGTTGLPKGVPRTHNSFLGNVSRTNAHVRPDDVVGLATPIGHAMAQQGAVGGSMMHGTTLALIAVPRARDIMEAVQKNRITTLGLVPTQLEDMLGDAELERYDLSSLRRVITAGAALRPETADRARRFFNKIGAEFAGSGFGSSEGPCAHHTPDETPKVFRTSIGRPMCEGDHWKAIDEQERELPPNTEGELVARGPSVFTGYYRSEAENREIFTRDSYYKMGDLGKIDEEGHIFITGRRKDVIQRGGEGIVPGEIESLLYLHPDIVAAAVVAMPDPRLGEKACAYVVLKPRKTLGLDEAVGFLKGLGAGKLLLPERLEVIDILPKTPIGKVDKKALRRDIEMKLQREGTI